MTSPPLPEGPGWSFQPDEPQPNAHRGSGTNSKPKHTGLLLTLGILIGLLVVAGASAGLLYATTGSYLPGALSSDEPDTPSTEPLASGSPTATPDAVPTDESPPPAEPEDQAIAFQSEPEQAWQIDSADLFKAADLDAPKDAPLRFVTTAPGTTENASGVQAVQSWVAGTQLVAGIDVVTGEVLWTHTNTSPASQYGPDSCFALDSGDIIGCATEPPDSDGALVFLAASSGQVTAQTDWASDVRVIAGSPKDLYIGGITGNAGLYLAHGTSADPDGDWRTETDDDLVAATELWHLSMSFNDNYAQLTLNSHALLVNAEDGAQVRVIADGYAQVVPGIGAFVSEGWREVEVIDKFTAGGGLWHTAGRSSTARPVLGIGRTLYDATSGTPLWELPSIAQTDDETQSVSLLPKHVMRVLDQGGPSGDSQTFSYDARTGEELWSRQTDRLIVQTAWDDVTIALTYSHFTPQSVLALNPATGTQLWEVDLPEPTDEDALPTDLNTPLRFVGTTLLIAGSGQITGLVPAS